MAPPASQLSSPATTHCVTMIVPSMSKITIRRGSTWIGIIIRRSTRSSTAPIQTEKFSLSPWPKYLWSLYLSLSELRNSGSRLHRKDPHGSCYLLCHHRMLAKIATARTTHPSIIRLNYSTSSPSSATIGMVQSLLEGLPVTHSRKAQALYYCQHSIHRSSNEWIKDLLNVIKKLAFHQWQHRNIWQQT